MLQMAALTRRGLHGVVVMANSWPVMAAKSHRRRAPRRASLPVRASLPRDRDADIEANGR